MFGELKRKQILKGFVNLPEEEDTQIEKARHGVYTDNAVNRKLQRVGQEYGQAAKEKPEAGQKNPKAAPEEEGGAPEANISLENHARQAADEALVKVANDPSADAEMRRVAAAELERRGIGVRAKNKKGDQSLRDGLADGDAKLAKQFEDMGFRAMDDADLQTYAGVEDAAHSFIKQVGGDEDGFDVVVTKTSEGYRVDKYPYDDADNFETTTVESIDEIEGVAKKYEGGGKVDAQSIIDSFDKMAEGDADFDVESFKAYVKEKGGVKAVKELAGLMGGNTSGGRESDVQDDEIADTIANMFEEAGMKVPADAKKALDAIGGGEGDMTDILQRWDDYTAGDADEYDSKALKDAVKKNGDAATIKALFDAAKEMPDDRGGRESETLDDEIADSIENLFEDCDIEISEEGQKALNALRGDANGDGKVSTAESLVKNFDDFAAGEVDEVDGAGLKALVKEKGDAGAIKALEAAMRKEPNTSGGRESDIQDDEIADTIENFFEEAGVEISEDGQKRLNELRGGAKESATKKAEKKAAKGDKKADASGDLDEVFIKKTAGDRAEKIVKRFMKNPEKVARTIAHYMNSDDAQAKQMAGYGRNGLMSLMDPGFRDNEGKTFAQDPKFKKFFDAADKAQQEINKLSGFEPDYKDQYMERYKKMFQAKRDFADAVVAHYAGGKKDDK